MPRPASSRSKGWRPVGRAAAPAFEPVRNRSVNSEPLSVRTVWTGWPKASRNRAIAAATVSILRSGSTSTWAKRLTRSIATKANSAMPFSLPR